MVSGSSSTPHLSNTACAIKFLEEVIINPVGSPEYILSDNDLKFDCMAVHDFSRKHDINWMRTSTYNPQGNGIADRMVGTVKRSLQRMMRASDKERDECLDQVLHGYRRRKGADGKSPFENFVRSKAAISRRTTDQCDKPRCYWNRPIIRTRNGSHWKGRTSSTAIYS